MPSTLGKPYVAAAVSSANQSAPHFPRFPATARISNRESKSLTSAVPSDTNVSSVVMTSPPKMMILPPLALSSPQSQLAVVAATDTYSTTVNLFALNSSSGASSVPLVPSSATTQNLATVAASILCDVATRYSNSSTFSSNDQEVEQQRRQFFKVVEKVSKEAENCKSAAVFCETLFLHVKQQIESTKALALSAANSAILSAAPRTTKALTSSAASSDDFAGLRIASACWALDVISRSNTSFSLLLQDIRKLIFPAIFVGFNAVDDMCRTRAKSTPAIAPVTALLTSAPYLVCDLFYQRHAKDQSRIRQLNIDQQSRTQRLLMNKNGAGMIVRTLNRQIIGKVFRAWRGHCKNMRVERFAREMIRKHGFRESRTSKLEAVFSRWKLMVEQNRNATLSERCHHLSHQLENAKGQFQLQCFRADKYLRVVEELREELRSARDTREELHKDNIRLQAQLESIQVQAREKLEAHVSLLCGEIHRWRTWAKRHDRGETERADQALRFCDRRVLQLMAQAKATKDFALDSSSPTQQQQNDDETSSTSSPSWTNNAAGSNDGLSSLQVFEAAEEEGKGSAMNNANSVNNNSSSGNNNSSAINVSASSKTEAALLQWCSWCLQQCPISTVKAVTNFATDFISGEVLIIIMNVAAPSFVSLGLLQDLHPIRRVERALESGRKAGLANLPKASDFAEGTADLIVLAVTEIFHLWGSRQRLLEADQQPTPQNVTFGQQQSKGKKIHSKKSFQQQQQQQQQDQKNGTINNNSNSNNSNDIHDNSNNSGGRGENADDTGGDDDDEREASGSLAASVVLEDRAPVVTASDLPRYLDDCHTALEKFRDNNKQNIAKDRLFWKLELGALVRGAYIAKERQEGRQVTVLDRKDMIRFTKFQKTRFNNLQNRYRLPPLDYAGAPWIHFELQLDLLRESLHNFYADLRRCFTYYCNGSPTMPSAGYWSFCNDIRAADGRAITRTHLDRIFVMANLEDVSYASVDPMLSFDDDLVTEAEAADDEENTETLLIPSEFVECLIRIADLKVPGKMIHEKFNTLMREFVNPFACKSETDKFRRDINNTSILAVTDRFRKDLSKVFVHFSHRKAGSGNKARYMSIQDFVFFAKESMLYSASSLDETAIQQIFQNVASPTDDMSGRELQAHEFIDALVCVSFFKMPSPFLQLEKKVEVTLVTMLNYLRGRLKGLITLSKNDNVKGGGGGSGGGAGNNPSLEGTASNVLSGTSTSTNPSSPIGANPNAVNQALAFGAA